MTAMRMVWVTSATDGLDHSISDEAMIAAVTQGAGQFRAQCGTVMVSASLSAPPGAVCPACAALRRHASVAYAECRQGVPRRWWARLWHRLAVALIAGDQDWVSATVPLQSMARASRSPGQNERQQ